MAASSVSGVMVSSSSAVGREWLLDLANADLQDENTEAACEVKVAAHRSRRSAGAVCCKSESLGYQEIDFSQNLISWRGCKAIMDIALQCQDLRVVKLFRNELSDRASGSLSRLVEECRTLEQLHLSYNFLTGKGATDIITAAHRGRSLRRDQKERGVTLWLRLEHNRIRDCAGVLEDLWEHRHVDFCEARDAQKCGPRVCKRCALVHLPYFSKQDAPLENVDDATAPCRGQRAVEEGSQVADMSGDQGSLSSLTASATRSRELDTSLLTSQPGGASAASSDRGVDDTSTSGSVANSQGLPLANVLEERSKLCSKLSSSKEKSTVVAAEPFPCSTHDVGGAGDGSSSTTAHRRSCVDGAGGSGSGSSASGVSATAETASNSSRSGRGTACVFAEEHKATSALGEKEAVPEQPSASLLASPVVSEIFRTSDGYEDEGEEVKVQKEEIRKNARVAEEDADEMNKRPRLAEKSRRVAEDEVEDVKQQPRKQKRGRSPDTELSVQADKHPRPDAIKAGVEHTIAATAAATSPGPASTNHGNVDARSERTTAATTVAASFEEVKEKKREKETKRKKEKHEKHDKPGKHDKLEKHDKQDKDRNRNEKKRKHSNEAPDEKPKKKCRDGSPRNSIAQADDETEDATTVGGAPIIAKGIEGTDSNPKRNCAGGDVDVASVGDASATVVNHVSGGGAVVGVNGTKAPATSGSIGVSRPSAPILAMKPVQVLRKQVSAKAEAGGAAIAAMKDAFDMQDGLPAKMLKTGASTGVPGPAQSGAAPSEVARVRKSKWDGPAASTTASSTSSGTAALPGQTSVVAGLGNIAEMQKRVADERTKLRLWVVKAKLDWEERRANGTSDARGETNDQEYYVASVGELFGPNNEYRAEGSVGKGVFSSVFRARDTKPGSSKAFALKFVRSNTMMRKAAEKEVETYRRLMRQAPAEDLEGARYIMGLCDLQTFVHQGHLCLVFDLLKCDLRTALAKYGQGRGLPMQTVAQYSRQIFLALRALRRLKIVHADLKPDNVLMSMNKAEVKVCDFGSSMDASEEVKTPYLQPRYYRAPEVIIGNTFDTAIDLWSAGVMLLELATGKICFTGRSNNAMLRQMLEVSGPLPRKMWSSGSFASRAGTSPPTATSCIRTLKASLASQRRCR
eukprot:TRINITY_DN16959_c0_g1_i2.p1 TRINITY_DN16959_c0_g1~~TRINITY_DN16959_c0_g1_i2.p1  ORF type:complete len:1164 (+),score=230.60 TRINITY_DN16959_c0_g1_i2:68-3493(+)